MPVREVVGLGRAGMLMVGVFVGCVWEVVLSARWYGCGIWVKWLLWCVVREVIEDVTRRVVIMDVWVVSRVLVLV